MVAISGELLYNQSKCDDGGDRMNRLLQRLRSHFGGLNSLILILYTTVVVALQMFFGTQRSTVFSVTVSLGVLLVMAVLGPVVLRVASRINACPRENKKDPVLKQVLVNGCFYLIPLAVFLFYFLACYPGGYSADCFTQYGEAVRNQYNDWHPVLHTLLAFKLPLMLTNGWSGSVVLFQSLCFCGVIGYTCQVIRKHFGIWPALITMAVILMSPLVMLTAMHPWKDVGFAICALLMAAYALQTVVTQGKWLCQPFNMICFILVAAITSIIRHNGILFTGPLVLGVVLYLSWKRALALLFGIVLLFVAVKGPVYSILKVEDPGRRQVEMLGLPMTVIGAVVTESPELLDGETLDFAYQVTPKEVWETKYELGSFNSVKFEDETNMDVIEEYGTGRVLSMMLSCFKADPETSMRSIIALTGRLYMLKDAYTGFTYPRVGKNLLGLEQTPNMTLLKLCKDYSETACRYFAPLYMLLGLQHLLLLVFVLAKVNLKRRQDWSKLLIVLSVFCYNFGSGLLLTAWADVFRFFFYTFMLVPVLLLVLCFNQNERSKPLFAWFKR